MYSLFVNELIIKLTFLYDSLSNENNTDKKTLKLTYFVNIKLKELRDILKTILRNICAINLNENKLIA